MRKFITNISLLLPGGPAMRGLVNLAAVTAFLGILIFSTLSGNAIEHKYIEDFTTTQYKDVMNTTAWWDTVAGELKLFPFLPTLAGTCDTPGQARGVTVSGDHAFVADFGFGLQVIDISDPTNPTLSGTCDTPGEAWGVTVSGDHAFVADYYSGLQVIDISDPTDPTLVGTCNTPSYALGVTVSGDHAFVADYASGLQVIDISDPTNPTLVGTCDTPEQAWGVTVSGDHAFIADYDFGLQVIDISDPTNPTLLGTCDTPSFAGSVAISGDQAFVADFYSGLQVIDISAPTNPTLVGTCDTPGLAWGLTVSGDHAFVADHGSGLQVIDISDPTNPTLAGTCDTPDEAWSVAISGDYAFVAARTSGLQVIDISDPTNPTIAGSCGTLGSAYGVTVSGDHAFVADGSGLQVIDISDPTNPTIAGSCDTPGTARRVTISGDYAFVADYASGLQVIDISDPMNPTIAGSCDTPGSARGVAVSGDHAFIADYDFGLQVIDISDPTNPTIVGTSNAPYVAMDIAVSGNHAFVANHNSGLQVIDISDPANPALVGNCDTPGVAWDVTVSGNHAFVADYTSGLQVIQVFQSEVDPFNNVGWSLAVDASSDTILSARLTTIQTDSVAWELSANGGVNWQGIAPDGSWSQAAVPGTDLLWRSTHAWAVPSVNPSVIQVEIDWLYAGAVLDSIIDIPNDQGRQVSIHWTRSGLDFVGFSPQVTEYAVYRRIDLLLAPLVEDGKEDNREGAMAWPPGEWHFVMTVPARAEDSYATVVPTLADSTISEGMYYTTFFVSALTATPGIYWDSDPDSGYSVDNLNPIVPQGFAVAYNSEGGTDLAWEECPDSDFQYIRVYRGESEDFTPDTGSLVHMTTGTTWRDEVAEGYRYYYKITSVDFSGNESPAALPASITGNDVPSVPGTFALYQNIPNPFNPTTTIRFDLPGTSHVKLCVYNVKGELVTTIVDRQMSEGRKKFTWTARDDVGVTVSSGIYFYRLVAGDFVQTKKMVLLR